MGQGNVNKILKTLVPELPGSSKLCQGKMQFGQNIRGVSQNFVSLIMN